MNDFFRPLLELAVVIPGIQLAYLPLRSYLKQNPHKLFLWVGPLLSLIIFLSSMVCWHFRLSTVPVVLCIAAFLAVLYARTLAVSLWRSGSVALAVCAVFSCTNSLVRALNAILLGSPERLAEAPWFCLEAGLIYHLICWSLVLITWYPATHFTREFLEEGKGSRMWYFFWILPILFIGINVFMIPTHNEIFYFGRILKGYILIVFTLLAILISFYALFLLMANSLSKNARLQKENHFLSLQQSRYDSLCTMIEETRHARHDLRHHCVQLSALAEEGDLEKIKTYLAAAQKKLPNLEMCFSKNRSVDSVVGHYCALARQENVPFLAQIDLPEQLCVDEIDLSLVLSNLLENALEASLLSEPALRQISIQAYISSGHFLLIQVENHFSGKIRQKNGIFQSSKRKGAGIGIQSVRRIVELNGGSSSFTFEDQTFLAKVMFRF